LASEGDQVIVSGLTTCFCKDTTCGVRARDGKGKAARACGSSSSLHALVTAAVGLYVPHGVTIATATHFALEAVTKTMCRSEYKR
jgi:hypothetical protein